jgi:SNF2 family DNA or RNA helicase
MLKLTDITKDSYIQGLYPDATVQIINVRFIGESCVAIYRTPIGIEERVLSIADEARLSFATSNHVWTFAADGTTYRLVAEANRIRLAHLYDPHLAVNTSYIDPLPHQISAVYGTMLNKTPLRFLLADDPGAGKTIMAGLFIKELILRGDIQRCLIVSPGNLVEQWQDELRQKFGLTFEILTNDNLTSAASGNWFLEHNLVIARLDKLSRNEDVQAKLLHPECQYDLIIFDEAHKLSASYYGNEISYTKRYQLAQRLSSHTRHLLLMTATPHNGKEEDFQLFLALLDPDRFEGKAPNTPIDASDLMRRMVKEHLLTFEGKPLFPERIAYTVPYALSPAEATLYTDVTEYVRTEYNRAAALLNDGRRGTIGFALTSLQRRLASSPRAIARSLERRLKRLSTRLGDLESAQKKHYTLQVGMYPTLSADDLEDFDDLSDEERNDTEDTFIDEATAAQTIEELRLEIATLQTLSNQAIKVAASGTDTKWQQLALLLGELFSDNPHSTPNLSRLATAAGAPDKLPHSARTQKIVIFTEHKDTLDYLTDRITTLLGRNDAVVVIHGGVSREQRRAAQDAFLYAPTVQVLLATDAAGEGINLQRAHLMVNYDIPWNPNRLEQRFGRIHRIKQTEVCFLWNLIAKDTREGDVYETLFRKLEEARKALGGQVFDVLGKVLFADGSQVRSLRDLLIEAIVYGNTPAVRNRINEVVNHSLDIDALRTLIEDKALSPETLSAIQVAAIRSDLERANARRLQPHFIAGFFQSGLRAMGGTIHQRERGRYQITHVPAPLRHAPHHTGTTILAHYERVTFDRALVAPSDAPLADYIDTGHPLMQAIVSKILDQYAHLLTQGTILVDENDHGLVPRVVYALDHAVYDASTINGAQRVLSRRVLAIELDSTGSVREIRTAPHLDARPLRADEPDVATLLEHPAMTAVRQIDSTVATQYAIAHSAHSHLDDVRTQRMHTITRTRDAVHARLTGEITHWDQRAAHLRNEAAKGKPNATVNALLAQRRADELEQRRKQRMADLEREQHITAGVPTVTAGMLIVPIGLIHHLQQPLETLPLANTTDTQAVAAHARAIVMHCEQTLGFEPTDRETEKVGYDIESLDRRTGALRFIEVKGRIHDATTITVTRNEILTSFNAPQNYYLAIVAFGNDNTYNLYYVKNPFADAGITTDFSGSSVNFELADLIARAYNPLASPA